MTIIVPSDLTNFDPTANSNISGTIGSGKIGYAVYDVLVSQETKTFSIVPNVAESLVSSDGVTWTLKVRPGVKFTDGTTYDAAAVKTNWQRHGDPANASQALSAVQAMQSIDVVDPLTLRVTLKSADGQWPRTVARRLSFIASPAAIAKGNIGTNPVGAGPFMLKDWVRDDHTTFVRNPNYWNAPRPYLDQVTFKYIIDDSQAYNTFDTSADVQQTASYVNSDKATKAGYSQTVVTPSGGTSLIFNEAKGAPYNDARFRKAVSLALDYDLLNKSVNNGLAPVAKSFFDQASPFYDSGAVLNTTDKAQAQQLFNQVAADNGGQVKMNIICIASSCPLAQAIQGQLNGFDKVKVDISQQAVGVYVGNIPSGNYEAAIWNLIVFDPEPNMYANFRTGNVRDYSRYSNPDMDKALDTGHTSLDQNTRIAAYKTVQQLIVRDTPEIYVWRAPNYWLSKSNVKGVELFEDGALFLDRVWLKR